MQCIHAHLRTSTLLNFMLTTPTPLQIAFGRIHGHFDVPRPPPNENGKNNTKTDTWKLYAWVNSLHGMYRSYKLGRQAGSLDDERVVLLIKHGFVFKRT